MYQNIWQQFTKLAGKVEILIKIKNLHQTVKIQLYRFQVDNF